jgi:uncharacterized protein (DUF486 family)
MMVWPARSDLAHHILLRKTQPSDIHCINFSACKNGAPDQRWHAIFLSLQSLFDKQQFMNTVVTIILLILSNVFMTFAWYGHLKLQDMGKLNSMPLFVVIVLSWLVAFFEYSLQIPANRLGYVGNGGPFSLMQLKIIQEVITLVVFAAFSMILFKVQIQWNHLAAFCCLVLAVYFVFMK